MLKKPQIVGILFVIAVFALITTGIKSPVTGTQFEPLTKEEATARWNNSGHARVEDEAFAHWDEDDPAEIPTRCAKCHSTDGFLDFAADGSVDNAVPAANVKGVYCTACHTDPDSGALREFASVEFPSGHEMENLGQGATCMNCHQGRAHKGSVDDKIEAAEAAFAGTYTDDTISPSISFTNIHYYAAAATNFGTLVQGGYEYDGKYYDSQFAHVDGYNDCTTCHDPHTLQIRKDNCATCHTDPANTSYWGGINDVKNIRYLASCVDYDGDGDKSEGIYYEIDGLKHTLWDYISQYSKEISGIGVVKGDAYPYYFKDNNGNGVADANEQIYPNQYRSYTPSLIRAVYNYQVVSKDPGGFAHGGKYLIQLMVDGINDLSEALGAAAPEGITRDASPLLSSIDDRFRDRLPRSYAGSSDYAREDEGHFNGGSDAWRHWDEDGAVPGRCARCHTATGLATYLATGANAEDEPISNGMLCTTCHTSPPAMRSTGPVTMPSGAVVDLGDTSNLCLNCHQGRASKSTIDAKIASGNLTFSNIHYYPVGASFFGTDAKGGYEYPGKTYVGQRIYSYHAGSFDTCVECHMGTNKLCDDCPTGDCDHNVKTPNPADCITCHGQDSAQPSNPNADPALFTFDGIRPASTPDYDGDGNMAESVKYEIKTLEEALYAQILWYATNVIGAPIIYDSHSYPYFFNDNNGNGLVDPGEAIYPNQYRSYDAKLLAAAYNYQFSKKEPGAWAHNSRYITQILIDAIEDLGGIVTDYHRY